MDDVALIIGGSAGIDRALAIEFARHGHNIVLVSRNDSNVSGVAMEIAERFAVDAQGIVVDLCAHGACEGLLATLMEKSIEVEILVNIAGLGERGLYQFTPWELGMRRAGLNTEPLVRLTDLFLRQFTERGRGRILNVGFAIDGLAASDESAGSDSKASGSAATNHEGDVRPRSNISICNWTEGSTTVDLFDRVDAAQSRARQSDFIQKTLRKLARTAYTATMKGDRAVAGEPPARTALAHEARPRGGASGVAAVSAAAISASAATSGSNSLEDDVGVDFPLEETNHFPGWPDLAG